MPSSHFKPQSALYILPLRKSNSFNKIATITLQNLDSNECEQFEQLRPISLIMDTKSKKGAKL